MIGVSNQALAIEYDYSRQLVQTRQQNTASGTHTTLAPMASPPHTTSRVLKRKQSSDDWLHRPSSNQTTSRHPAHLARAKAGDAEAQFQLGAHYHTIVEESMLPFGANELTQTVAAQDAARLAVTWYQRAANQGHVKALNNLGICYKIGLGVISTDETAAVACFTQAAQQGDSRAQFHLGRCLWTGKGIQKDKTQAIGWLRSAAEQGHADAQALLGHLLANKDEATLWLFRAASQGHREAQFRLGVSLHDGQGISKDARAALKWLSMAAEQGHTEAQTFLGAYLVDHPNADSANDGLRWLQQAAKEHNHMNAQFALACAYLLGLGKVNQSDIEARNWFIRAAERGHQRAQLELAIVLEHQDTELAIVYYLLAAASTGTTAINAQHALERLDVLRAIADIGSE